MNISHASGKETIKGEKLLRKEDIWGNKTFMTCKKNEGGHLQGRGWGDLEECGSITPQNMYKNAIWIHGALYHKIKKNMLYFYFKFFC